jgi:hypothetical protein
MADAEVSHAAERVTLACRALSAAATDLRLAHSRHGVKAVDKAADTLESEMERVCEMAEEVAALAANLGRWAPPVADAEQPVASQHP